MKQEVNVDRLESTLKWKSVSVIIIIIIVVTVTIHIIKLIVLLK